MERLREHLRESWRALRAVFHNRALRQLQLAWAGSIIGSWAYAVALVVFAYDHGGASAVGLIALIRWLPAAVASPFTAILGDRYPRVPRDARLRPAARGRARDDGRLRADGRARSASSTCWRPRSP